MGVGWSSPWAFVVFHMWLGLTFHMAMHFIVFTTGRGAAGGVSVS